jgi:sulfide:quinone oxidoreductase
VNFWFQCRGVTLRLVAGASAHRVVVAGGGFAALEAMLAIRRLAGERVSIDLVSAQAELHYRPLEVVEPFGLGEAPRFDLAGIAGDQDANLHVDSVAEVVPGERVVRTGAGNELAYDSLVVAIGARPETAVPGAFTYRGAPDGAQLRSHLDQIESGQVGNVVFGVPAGVAWPLSLYEIALMTAARVAARRSGTRLELVTAEAAPLAIFGRGPSEAVERLLRERGVQVRASAAPVSFQDGMLTVIPRRSIPADLVVALPRLRGIRIPGLPHDKDGFIPVDSHGRAVGAEGVFAAGDATAFPVKQGGIATQQAEVVAREVARSAGAPVSGEAFRPVLRGVLLTGEGARFMRTDLAGGSGDSAQVSSRMLWWPETKVVGRYLSQYLSRKVEPIEPTPPLPADAIPIDVDLSNLAADA